MKITKPIIRLHYMDDRVVICTLPNGVHKGWDFLYESPLTLSRLRYYFVTKSLNRHRHANN